jgi:hypothetical protein
MRVWWCWASTIPTARKATAPPRSPPRRFWKHAAIRPGSTAIPWFFWRRTRPACRTLDEAARKYLAWESILAEQNQLNLSPYQVTQAETQKTAADSTVTARLPETYQWLLVPVQATPQLRDHLGGAALSGTDALAVRASKKLRTDELYLTSFAATRLRMELDRIPLWRGDHVPVKQLVEDFARYLYLPRLKDSVVLLDAIRDGINLLTGRRTASAMPTATTRMQAATKGCAAGPW